MRKNSKKLFNHVGTNHEQHVIEVIKQVPEEGNHKDLPPGVGETRKFNEAWTRYDSKSHLKLLILVTEIISTINTTGFQP